MRRCLARPLQFPSSMDRIFLPPLSLFLCSSPFLCSRFDCNISWHAKQQMGKRCSLLCVSSACTTRYSTRLTKTRRNFLQYRLERQKSQKKPVETLHVCCLHHFHVAQQPPITSAEGGGKGRPLQFDRVVDFFLCVALSFVCAVICEAAVQREWPRLTASAAV